MRAVRPSDVHGRPPDPTALPPRPEGANADDRRRGPRWSLLGGLAALALLGAGLLVAAPVDDGSGGRVDVATEEDAVSALAIFGTQVRVYEALAAREDVLAPPGPGDTALAAEQAAAEIRQALVTGRAMPQGDPRPRAYWSHPAHDEHLRHLEGLAERLREIALLAATHDTVYGNAGAIPLPQAQSQLMSLFSTGAAPAPLATWATALLAEIDGTPSGDTAAVARAETVAWWQQEARAAAPPRTDLLADYVAALPPRTLRGLQGHPVAGPALARLGGRRA